MADSGQSPPQERDDNQAPPDIANPVGDQATTGAANPAIDQAVRSESIKAANISDQVAPEDSLGFQPYVEAIAEFLTNEETQPPLTLSVEGGWGSGKSSFMKQLEKEIKEIEKRKNQPEPKVVWFNAWRHDKVEALWAAFALEFLRKISTPRTRAEVIPTWQGHFRLLLLRLKWKENWQDLLRIFFLSLFFGSLALALPVLFLTTGIPGINEFSNRVVRSLADKAETDKSKASEKSTEAESSKSEASPAAPSPTTSTNSPATPTPAAPTPATTPIPTPGASPTASPTATPTATPESSPSPSPSTSVEAESSTSSNSLEWLLNILLILGGLGGSATGALALFLKLGEIIGDPKNDLKKYLEHPNYESQVAFIEKFHDDFQKIVTAYAGEGNKVYVFIDDLDRCELTKAADLMQGLNLLISDDPHLIFILGMDREKVAAGIALKQKDVLPYLPSSPVVLDTATQDSRVSSKGLEYGYAFIEKFIQLPFQVPQASEEQFRYFLETMSSQKQQKLHELMYKHLGFNQKYKDEHEGVKIAIEDIDKELDQILITTLEGLKDSSYTLKPALWFRIFSFFYSLRQAVQWKRESESKLIYLIYSENCVELICFLKLLLYDQVPSFGEECIEQLKAINASLDQWRDRQTLQIEHWTGSLWDSLQNKIELTSLRILIVFNKNDGLWKMARSLDPSQLQRRTTQPLIDEPVQDSKELTESIASNNRTIPLDLVSRREALKVSVTEDSETIRRIVLMVAPALDHNPRRIKQFINLFRLKVFIGSHTGLFDEVKLKESDPALPAVTLEQLGKFTALCLKYPLLRVDLEKDVNLLANLQSYALRDVHHSTDKYAWLNGSNRSIVSSSYDNRTKYWGSEPKLVQLLRAGCVQTKSPAYPKKPEDYSLEKVDVKQLLQISPRVDPLDRVPLKSEKGVDYRRLREYLRAGQWRQADQETLRVMLKAADREKRGYFRPENLENFPCQDLQTIDKLWVTASKGKFGFSVQKQIWQECGSPMSYNEQIDWEKFGDRVGWCRDSNWLAYDNLTFNLEKSLKGELPMDWEGVSGGVGVIGWVLFSRAAICKL